MYAMCVEVMRQGAGAGGFDEDWADLAVQCGGISPTSLRSERGRGRRLALELGGSRFTMGLTHGRVSRTHWSPSLLRHNFDFGAPQQLLVPMKKVQYGPLNMFINS